VKNIVCNDIRHFFPMLQDCRDDTCCSASIVDFITIWPNGSDQQANKAVVTNKN
jgi:hypothetical protein